MEKTTVYLSKDAMARLQQLAERRGQPADALIRQAVDELLATAEDERLLPRSLGIANGALDDGEEQPLPSWIGMVESGPDDGYDSTNYEEWLAKHWHPE
jgi:predicted transcriptional regulator